MAAHLVSYCLFLFRRVLSLFFFNDPASTEIYTLSLHDALPISSTSAPAEMSATGTAPCDGNGFSSAGRGRSEEHTSELQSLRHLVCRLLLEKKKKGEKVIMYHYLIILLVSLADGEIIVLKTFGA